MNPIIVELVALRGFRHSVGPILGPVLAAFDKTDPENGIKYLDFGFDSVLAWLRDRSELNRREPLELEQEFPWARYFRRVIPATPLSEMFQLTPEGMDFLEEIPDLERDAIATYVVQNMPAPELMD